MSNQELLAAVDKLLSEAEALNLFASTSKTISLNIPRSKRLRTALADLKAARQDGTQGGGLSPSGHSGDNNEDNLSSSLGEFLTSVGTEMVNAQKLLDQASMDYVGSVANSKAIEPATFRLPSLKGDFKFGLNKVSKEGLNLLFFSNKQEESQYQEQSLSFEIASVPISRDVAKSSLDSLPMAAMQLILPLAEREKVLAALQQQEADPELSALLKAWARYPHRVLAFHSTTRTEAPNIFVAAKYQHTSPQGDGNELHYVFWQLKQEAGQPISAERLWDFPSSTNQEEFNIADKLLDPLFKEQKNLLDAQQQLKQ